MSKAVKIVFYIFLGLGILGFVLVTGFLTNWSERSLVAGFQNLIIGGAGAYGAYLGRRSTGRAVLMAILFAVLAAALLVLFFSVIWPML